MTTKIYTKRGDKGESDLFNGERRFKSDIIFDALGTIQELNSHIGLAISFLSSNEFLSFIKAYDNNLEKILETSNLISELSFLQSLLIDLGTSIATPINNSRSTESKLERAHFSDEHVPWLEKRMDYYQSTLPKLSNFILPSGNSATCQLHVCTSVCRRAERIFVLLQKRGEVEESVIQFLNRLSDYLFVIARKSCQLTGHVERCYQKDRGIFQTSSTK